MEILIQILMYLASICLGVWFLGVIAVVISVVIYLTKLIVDLLKSEKETK